MRRFKFITTTLAKIIMLKCPDPPSFTYLALILPLKEIVLLCCGCCRAVLWWLLLLLLLPQLGMVFSG